MEKNHHIERIDRRTFILKLGSCATTISIAGASIGTAVGNGSFTSTRLMYEQEDFQPVPGTRPEITPIDDHYKMVNINVPKRPDLKTWRLKISGLVERPLDWMMSDLRKFEAINEFVTLTCISNPVGGPLTSTTLWTGVSLQDILPHWNLKKEATHLKIWGADGFYETVALETIATDRLVMLAYEWNEAPLPLIHGYPLRILIPNRYGMKQPKWIESIEAMDHWEPGYSVKNTWDRDAIMKATSVIDTVYLAQNDMVQIGGIAHAGSRGISRVEVRIDGGSWQDARLGKPLSDLSWRVWRFDWPYEKGDHEFTVRCYDKFGRPQSAEESPPYPDGASGWHSVTKDI